jgi:hypothetical protein
MEILMNPYKILDVRADAVPKEIIQAMARAMREKRHSGRKLAQAQKMLLDPISGAAQRFLHCLDLYSAKQALAPFDAVKVNGKQDLNLTRLTIFDEDVCNRKKSS